MLARSQLGYDASVFAVHIDLRSDDARQKLAAVRDHSGRGLITRRFDSEDSSAHDVLQIMLTHAESPVSFGRGRADLLHECGGCVPCRGGMVCEAYDGAAAL